MSNLVALTNVRHGEVDGSVTEVLYGQSVEDLPQDVIDYLVTNGLAVEASAETKIDALFADPEVASAEADAAALEALAAAEAAEAAAALVAASVQA